MLPLQLMQNPRKFCPHCCQNVRVITNIILHRRALDAGDPGGGIGDYSCEKCQHSNFKLAWTKHPPEGADDLLCDDGVIETHAEKCTLNLESQPLGQCRGDPYDCDISSLFTCRPTYGGDYQPATWTWAQGSEPGAVNIGGTGVDHATCSECRRETGETETEPPYFAGAGQCAIGEGWCFIHKDATATNLTILVAPACYLPGDTNPTPSNPGNPMTINPIPSSPL